MTDSTTSTPNSPSRESPATLSTIPLPTGDGMLGLTQYPGRCEPDARAERRRQVLQADLANIHKWGAKSLVSLMPQDELRRLGVDYIGREVQALGMTWYHLPIEDMEVPDWTFEHRWQYAGVRLRELLRSGGRVVFHCRAGLGRTGTIAAKLLVELGVPPGEAISQVRHARSGTIQTNAQENYVMAQKRASEAGDLIYSRRLGGLLGGAVGDGFGFSLFSSQTGLATNGLRQPLLQNGQLRVSDDTQMSLFTLEGLVRGLRARQTDDDALFKQLALSWQDWLQTQGYRPKLIWHASHLLKHAGMHAKRQPGLTNLRVLEKGVLGTPDKPINDCQACGAVPRAAPIGLLPGMNPERAFKLAVRAAAATHGHANGQLPAGVLAAMLSALVRGAALPAALEETLLPLQAHPDHQTTQDALLRVLEKSGQIHFGRSARGLPPGLSGPGALAVGLYAALVARDMHEALHLASDPEYGSDSAAAVAGQLYGAQHGIRAVPHAWAENLDVFDALCELLHWAGPILRQRN